MPSEDTNIPHRNLSHDLALGLPYELAEEIAEDNLGAPLSWFGASLFMLIMCSGFVIGGFYLWPTLEAYDKRQALKVATSLDGISFYTNFGISLLIGLFAWIIATATCVSIIIRLAPKRAKATLYLSAKNHFIGSTPRLFGLHKIWTNGTTIETAQDYINAIANRMCFWTGRVVLIMIGLALFFFWRETSWNETFTEKAVVENTFWSNTRSSYLWSDAVQVELGCNFIEARRGRRSSSKAAESVVIYKVKWEDGQKVSLHTENQINGKHWLDNFENIDAEIRSGNAKFERWVWLERNPLHPTCLNHYRSKLGPDLGPRFDNLLRVRELD